MVFAGKWVMHAGVRAPVANRCWLVPGADSRRRWEFPLAFNGEWAMHAGRQRELARTGDG